MIQKPNPLLNLGIFKEFYTEEIEIVSEYISLHRFYDLQEIMPQKEQATSFGIVLSGEVNVIDENLENLSRVSGDLLGEIALVHSTPRSADFIAASDGSIAIMTFDDIEKLKIRRPYLAVKLIHYVTQTAIQDLQHQGIQGTGDGIGLLGDETQISHLSEVVQLWSNPLSQRPLYALPIVAEVLRQQAEIRIHQPINDQALVGGTETIGSQILLGNLKVLIALREPLEISLNPGHLEAVSRLCDLNNVLFTTNLLTARILLDALESIV
ncbi:MAG: cyclic nucleotide-binding domain-containing protein [Microcoleaceae cyanobacterium]